MIKEEMIKDILWEKLRFAQNRSNQNLKKNTTKKEKSVGFVSGAKSSRLSCACSYHL